MADDIQLLREYSTGGSQEAFGRLVERYLNLVYSAALHQTGGNQTMSADISQTVFIDLARKASTLPATVVLGGWLYKHTGFVAAQTLRSERRRQIRETKAVQMQALDNNPEPAWDTLAPHLHEAMSQLSETDRNALILRYFEGRDLRSVGLALGGSTEDAARMRVARALEKLRGYFKKRGLNLTTTALASLLAANAVTAAPVALAATITGVALAAASATGTSWTASTLAKILVMSHLKTAVALLVIGTLATMVVMQKQSISQMQTRLASLTERSLELENLRTENERLRSQTLGPGELASLRNSQLELMRLRNQKGPLRPPRSIATAPKDTNSIRAAAPEQEQVDLPYQSFHSEVQSHIDNGQTLVAGGWTTENGKRCLTFVTLTQTLTNDDSPDSPYRVQLRFNAKIISAPDSVFDELGLQEIKASGSASDAQKILSAEEYDYVRTNLLTNNDANILSSPAIVTGEGCKASISIGDTTNYPGSSDPVHLGQKIDIDPEPSADGSGCDLGLKWQYTKTKP